MGIKKILTLTTLGFVNAFAASQPGLGYSASAAGVNTFNAIVTPYVFGYLQNVTLPDQQIQGGNLSNIHFTLDAPPKPEDIEFILNPATNGIQFNTTDITAHISADFSFSYLFISASGTAKIDIKDITADLGLDLATQPGTNGELAPAVKSRDVVLVINQDNIDIDLQGEGVDKIASFIKPVIKSLIANQITQQIKTQLPTIINTNVNQDLALWGT